MKTLYFLTFAFIAFHSVSAQNWQKATLYLVNGETVEAEVDFKDWKVSPYSISVKNGGLVESYNGSHVKRFTLTATNNSFQVVSARLRYYMKSPIPLTISPVDHDDSVAVYAEVIYADKFFELFSLQDAEARERFFIKQGKSSPEELVHYTINIEKDGHQFTNENNHYRNQLGGLLNDCPEAAKKAKGYSQKYIVAALKAYAECKGVTPSSVKQESKSLINLGVLVGSAHITYKGYGSIGAPFFGGNVQVLSKRSMNNFFASIEVIYMPGLKGDTQSAYGSAGQLAIYGGRYIGKQRLQGVIFTGLSSINRSLDTGIGIGFDKRFVLTGSIGLGSALTDAALGEPGAYYSFKLKVYPRFRAKPVKTQ